MSKYNNIYIGLYVVIMVSLFLTFLWYTISLTTSIHTFNLEKDYCLQWKFPDCDFKDEEKHYTFNLDMLNNCNNDIIYENLIAKQSLGKYVLFNQCLNWTSKKEKLTQDVAELKQWKDSLKEECVENETINKPLEYNENMIFRWCANKCISEQGIIIKENITIIIDFNDCVHYCLRGIITPLNNHNETICKKSVLVRT